MEPAAPPQVHLGEFTQGPAYFTRRPDGWGDYLLMYTVSGAGEVRSGGAAVCTTAGQLTLYEPGAPQDYRTDPGAKRWQLAWAHFLPRPTWSLWMDWPLVSPGFRAVKLEDAELRERVLETLREALRSTLRAGALSRELGLNSLERVLLWVHEGLEAAGRFRIDRRIRRAMDLLATRPSQRPSIPELARVCGLSESRFAHLFHAETGTTPQRHGERCRLDHAARLLEQPGLNVGEIAARCGFENPFYFSTRFRRCFGVSPVAFRRELMRGHLPGPDLHAGAMEARLAPSKPRRRRGRRPAPGIAPAPG